MEPNKTKFEAIKDHNHFSVPEGYFDGLPEKIQQRIAHNKAKPENKLQMITPYLAVAGVFVAIFMIWNLVLPAVMEQNQQQTSTSIADTSQKAAQESEQDLLIPTYSTNTSKQPTRSIRENNEAQKAEKAAIITRKLNLTVKEAQEFWPIYNNFEKELKALQLNKKQSLSPAPKDKNKLKEKEMREACINYIGAYSRMAKLRQKYHQKFLDVLPAKKVYKLYQTEERFDQSLPGK